MSISNLFIDELRVFARGRDPFLVLDVLVDFFFALMRTISIVALDKQTPQNLPTFKYKQNTRKMGNTTPHTQSYYIGAKVCTYLLVHLVHRKQHSHTDVEESFRNALNRENSVEEE